MWSICTVIFSGSLHKIPKSLKKEHNIEISHQSIENIIFKSNHEIEHKKLDFFRILLV